MKKHHVIKKKIVSFILIIVMAFGMPALAEAAFSQGYQLGSDPVENLIAVAEAQIDKKQADLGYTTAWCSYFVTDCAKLAGLEEVFPGRGSVASLYNNMINAGGKEVTTPKRGDLVFYYCTKEAIPWVHVGIMVSESRSVEGNFSNKVAYVDDQYKDTRGHSVTSGTIKRIYIRPDYGRAGKTPSVPAPEPKPEPQVPKDVCKCKKSYAGTYIVVTQASPLTLRAGHGTEFDVITRIPKGSEVKVTLADGTWAHVKWKNFTGFCSMEFLAQKITVDGCDYMLTGKSEAAFLGMQKNKAVDLVIPATVVSGKRKYNVTEISAGALKNTKIKSIRAGKNIKSIGTSSFCGCKGLKKIILGTEITKIGKNTLKDVYSRAEIQIPKKKKNVYLKLLNGAGMGKKMTVSTY